MTPRVLQNLYKQTITRDALSTMFYLRCIDQFLIASRSFFNENRRSHKDSDDRNRNVARSVNCDVREDMLRSRINQTGCVFFKNNVSCILYKNNIEYR